MTGSKIKIPEITIKNPNNSQIGIIEVFFNYKQYGRIKTPTED